MTSINNKQKEQNIRVLIVSNNPFSSTNANGKTLASNFREWGAEYIAQLYFSDETPDFSGCVKYYKITEIDQIQKIRDIFKEKHINRLDTLKIKTIKGNGELKKIECLIRNSKWLIFYILRDIFWSLNIWKTKKLEKFINEFKPEIIFFLAGNNIFAYHVVKWIGEKWNLPILPYFTDDYLGVSKWYDVFAMLQCYRIKKAIKNMKKFSKFVCVICDEMGKEYVKKFKFIKYYLVYNKNSNYLFVSKKRKKKDDQVKILYAGNLEFGRWKMLCHIADVVNEIDSSVNVSFDIYTTNKLTQSDLRMLSQSNRVNFRGAVDGNMVYMLIDNADIVVHVESFDQKDKKSTRFSISTKIFDYLAMGKCILAYGPSDVASIRLLKTKPSAVVIDNKNDLSEFLNILVRDNEIIRDYEKKSRELYKEIETNSINIEQIIKNAIANHAI